MLSQCHRFLYFVFLLMWKKTSSIKILMILLWIITCSCAGAVLSRPWNWEEYTHWSWQPSWALLWGIRPYGPRPLVQGWNRAPPRDWLGHAGWGSIEDVGSPVSRSQSLWTLLLQHIWWLCPVHCGHQRWFVLFFFWEAHSSSNTNCTRCKLTKKAHCVFCVS